MSQPVLSSRRRHGTPPPRILPPWVVLAGALLLTILVTWATESSARARERTRFERAAVEARQRVESRLAVHIALLQGAAGLMAVQPDLRRGDFAEYVARLHLREAYPGMQGIGITVRIAGRDVDALEQRMRRDGIAGYDARPDDARAERHAITYLEPLDARNRAALGFDMFTEGVRRQAMERARDSATAAMSGRVTLVQEIAGPRQPGFLIYVPVYRGNRIPATVAGRRDSLVAFAYAPFRADDLFRGIFGTTHAPQVVLRIYDGTTVDDSALLHDSGAEATTDRRFARIADTLRIRTAGRPWTIVATPAQAFADGRRTPMAPIVATFGIAVSLALFGLARARRGAMTAVADARDLFGRVLEQAPVAICVLRGPQHVFEVANSPYRRLLAEDPIGKPVRAIVRDADGQEFIDRLDQVYRSGQPVVTQGTALAYDRSRPAADGPSYFNVLYYPFTRRDGSTDGVITVAVDVTAEVTARRDAEVARREAEHANRAKSDFLAAMSHELRTPLNAIAGYVQLVEMGVYGPVTGPQHEALSRVQRSGSHLLSLINDVLNFAKLEAGRVEFAIGDVELRSVIAQVVHMVEPLLEARQLTCSIEVERGIVVRADEEKLRQILLNLLSNAAKFTDEGGITLHTGPLDGEGDADAAATSPTVALHITDTGIGIPEDRQSAVFDPFVQVNRGLTSTTEGTGLGLAISHDLARGMGATLTVRSVVGRGSTFTLTLPRAAA